MGSHLAWADPRRGWDFVSTGHGDVPWEACFRMLNAIGYDGPISVEWEDAGMDRLVGAPEALAVRPPAGVRPAVGGLRRRVLQPLSPLGPGSFWFPHLRPTVPVMTARLLVVSLDARDPAELARFWGGLLHRDGAEDADGVVLPGADTQLGLRFVHRPTEADRPNRAHLHLTSTSPADQQQTVASALELGARHVEVGQPPEAGYIVLADPGGNPFCVIEPGNRFLAGTGLLGELTCDGTRETGLFWSRALGWPLVWDRDQETAVQSPAGGTKLSWGGEPAPPRPVRATSSGWSARGRPRVGTGRDLRGHVDLGEARAAQTSAMTRGRIVCSARAPRSRGSLVRTAGSGHRLAKAATTASTAEIFEALPVAVRNRAASRDVVSSTSRIWQVRSR